VEDTTLRGAGLVLKQKLWDAAQNTLEEWTGEKLTPCSLYGVRIYQEGAVLATHVDRVPLVTSAIINVAQDVDEPWPIEVYAHDGKAYNVTMEPGDMVLYESHSVLHGTYVNKLSRLFCFYYYCVLHLLMIISNRNKMSLRKFTILRYIRRETISAEGEILCQHFYSF
jgi:hypothetical protein